MLTLMSLGGVLLIRAENDVSTKSSSEKSLDARRAKSYLDKICRIGPRVSGSQGMKRQQKMIVEHFTRFGADVRFQSFDVAHPVTGRPVRMNNLIVSWNPQSKQRVLFACHYDTRPYPDRDRRNPRGIFLGANDGASGVALFMELAHHMQSVKSTHGVDFVFFDGEELIYPQQQGNQVVDRGEYFLGSTHFAKEYRDRPPEHRYVYGILVDMIADKNLNIYLEKNSLKYAPKLTQSIWAVAKRLKISEFHARPRHEVRDDHLPLNEIAKIPTCNIIDFDYPAWHTTRDVPRRCSGTSMVKVGRVLLAWLKELPPPKR
ncbi:MAG: M28 family peptidase [Planctomycetes bacterium]|nr:M28 family peptidase [Planctomycetota bacterium]